jgi:hypothetical protein
MSSLIYTDSVEFAHAGLVLCLMSLHKLSSILSTTLHEAIS